MTATLTDPRHRRTTRQGETTAHPGGPTPRHAQGNAGTTLPGEVLAPSW